MAASPTLMATSVRDRRANASSSVTSSPTNTVVASAEFIRQVHEGGALVGVAGECLEDVAAGLERGAVDVGRLGAEVVDRLAAALRLRRSNVQHDAGGLSLHPGAVARAFGGLHCQGVEGRQALALVGVERIHRSVASLHSVAADHVDVVFEPELGKSVERTSRHDRDVH